MVEENAITICLSVDSSQTLMQPSPCNLQMLDQMFRQGENSTASLSSFTSKHFGVKYVNNGVI